MTRLITPMRGPFQVEEEHGHCKLLTMQGFFLCAFEVEDLPHIIALLQCVQEEAEAARQQEQQTESER